MHIEVEKHGACCKSCAVGRPCEGSCPNRHGHDHDEPTTLMHTLAGPRVLRRLGSADLVLVRRARSHGRPDREPTLRVPTDAGTFMVHMFVTRRAVGGDDGKPRLHIRGSVLVFGRLPPGVSVRIVAEETSRFSDGGPLKMEVLHVERSDAQVPTRQQQKQAHELVRQVQDLVRPHLAELQAAYEWVRAEERLEEIKGEMARLTSERAAVQAKLTGHPPW